MDRDGGLDTPSKPYSCLSIPNYRWESTQEKGIYGGNGSSCDKGRHDANDSHLLDRIFGISLA